MGSLLRPPKVQAAHAQLDCGVLDPEQARAIEDAAIRDAVTMQQAVGLSAITDGEIRRRHFLVDFLTGLQGIVPAEASYAIAFHGAHGEQGETRSLLTVNAKIRRTRPIAVKAFEFLHQTVTHGTAKACIPSPTYLHMRGGRQSVPQTVYPDMEEFWADLVHAYHAEIGGLAEAGCRYLQIDEIVFAFLCDEQIRAQVRADGIDPDAAIEKYCAVVDAIAAGAPSSMTVAVHTCRGNHRSMWMADGGYDRVAEAVFSLRHVNGYFLEYDTDRAGGFEPLRFVPKDKRVVLGLVSSKRSELESQELLNRRVDQASRYVSLDRLCLSPQCGFASTEAGNRITSDIQRRKLALVVETARAIWGDA